MRFLPAGSRALLVEVGSTAEATALYAAAGEAGLRATDIVPAARTVLFDGVDDLDALQKQVSGLVLRPAEAAVGKVVEVPTVYDGADLEEVARQWSMTTREVVATHTSADLVVAFCGFAPGFAYCTGLSRTVTRRASPRTRVPARSVGLAGEFTGVYPTASPGGWQLVGRTALTLWDSGADPPALLAPGRRVRFVEVTP